MVDAVLFDLDNTLLGNAMETFMPSYLSLLSRYAVPLIAPENFVPALLAAAQATIGNRDPAVTNRMVFWEALARGSGLDPLEAEPFFDRFYATQFQQLQQVTQLRPAAPFLVRACMSAGLQVVVATDPLFPRTAVEMRLAWAGLPVSDFCFALVTTYEDMHATKPHAEYYNEVLTRIGCAAERALMVGDNWERDILPTADLGLFTFWIAPDDTPPRDSDLVNGYGSLDDLYRLVRDGWLHELKR